MKKKISKKTAPPKNKIKKTINKKLIATSEYLLDRDKNNTYIPNDESIDDLFDSDGHEEFVHPNHNLKKPKK